MRCYYIELYFVTNIILNVGRNKRIEKYWKMFNTMLGIVPSIIKVMYEFQEMNKNEYISSVMWYVWLIIFQLVYNNLVIY